MTACCKITCIIPSLPCEQLPYPIDHPRISRMWQRDKSKMPLLTLPYKYCLLRYSSSISSFHILKPTFLAAALFKKLKNSGKDLLQRSSESLIPSSSRKEMAINFVVPEVNLGSPFFFSLYFWSLAQLFTWYFISLGIDRENCYSYRSTPLPMPWSIGKPRSYRLDKCRNK